MTVRLGFAVAAHLEPEILVVDEVLAVGDAEFQKKAIGKMQDLSTGEGRTVLFVSHNMVSIKNLCTRVIGMENGCLKYSGKPDEVIDKYLNRENKKAEKEFSNTNSNKEVFLKSFEILGLIKTGSSFQFKINVYSRIEIHTEFALTFSSRLSQPIYQIYSGHVGDKFTLTKGENIINCRVDKLPLVYGNYDINLWLGTSSLVYDFHKNALDVNVQEGSIREGGPISSQNGYPVIENAKWHIND